MIEPQASELLEPSEAGRGKKEFFPSLQRECGPADTLILNFRDLDFITVRE